ncbi:MAG TPA: nucleotidyl transferase AbiEii/AbiGii toxin family protein [Pirellula sp.]|nr:nucleotidyl transferase AbiEii/AbiGii toxin family protein [Pirellula sp.]
MKSLDRVWNILNPVAPIKALAGGLALSYWGYPRSTQDIDIAVLFSNSASNSIDSHLLKAGLSPKRSNHVCDLGVMKVSQWRLPIPESFLDIDVDLLLGDSEFYQSALSRRIECDLVGTTQSIHVLSCEDLILFKALAGRMIDLADIRELRDRNLGSLDQTYLSKWTARLDISLSNI